MYISAIVPGALTESSSVSTEGVSMLGATGVLSTGAAISDCVLFNLCRLSCLLVVAMVTPFRVMTVLSCDGEVGVVAVRHKLVY